MEKIKCTIKYDGAQFAGFQYQPNERTIQGEIEKVLQKIHKGEKIRIHGSGRTDAGVHAMAQVIHFESPFEIDESGWTGALTTLLPKDIQLLQVEKVDSSFHARYDALSKTYRYIILNTKAPEVFKRLYSYHCPDTLDIEKMQAACKVFEGTHDFTSFASAKTRVRGSKVRTLTEVSIKKEADQIIFTIRGNGFLQHMIRIIVGAIIEVGKGKKTVAELEAILKEKDREAAGATIPAQGLYL